jgi:hypothetical protein
VLHDRLLKNEGSSANEVGIDCRVTGSEWLLPAL